MLNTKQKAIVIAMSSVIVGQVHATSFQSDSGAVQGSFDSTLTAGFGRRLQNQSCALVGDPNSACGSRANTAQWSAGDNGDLNYNKGDFFTEYVKGTHELLLKFPDDWKFMVRASWLHDFKADDTRRTALSEDAERQVVRDVRLLDFWVSKNFNIGGYDGRFKLGNQVINWGESLFAIGGINATNALDLQRLLVPGTQIKEAVLPAPMLSLSTTVAQGLTFEGYYQFRWNRNRVPPVGSYFSTADYYDKGREPVSFSGTNFNVTGRDPASLLHARSYSTAEAINAISGNGDFAVPVMPDKTPSNAGQYGLSLRYKAGDVDYGLYYLNYHDKAPVLNLVNNGSAYQWQFLENRKLYGISANMPLGNWAVGSELSYRPKDAVSLSGCFGHGSALDANTNSAAGVSTCPLWADKEKYQLHLTAMLQLTPGDHEAVLNALGADSAYLSLEGVAVHYSGVDHKRPITRFIEGVQVDQVPAAGYLVFLDRSTGGSPIAKGGGTGDSGGYVVDFNWTYDGKLVPGWQVTPGITYSHSLYGDTPTFTANYLNGAKAINAYVLFNQNPAVWQAGINFTKYFGGKNDPARQVYADRGFIGAFVSRNF